MQQLRKEEYSYSRLSFYLLMSNVKIDQLRRKRKGQTVNR